MKKSTWNGRRYFECQLMFLAMSEGFLVANADTWLGAGIRQLAVRRVAIAAVSVPNSQRYGSLKFEGEKISAFDREIRLYQDKGYVNSGFIIYCLRYLMDLR